MHRPQTRHLRQRHQNCNRNHALRGANNPQHAVNPEQSPTTLTKNDRVLVPDQVLIKPNAKNNRRHLKISHRHQRPVWAGTDHLLDDILGHCRGILENRVDHLHWGTEQQDLEDEGYVEYHSDENHHCQWAVEEWVCQWAAGKGREVIKMIL